jgi:hypothetical protein
MTILNNKGGPGNINYTFICLFPKKNDSKLPYDYRPIALSNVLVKTVTKTIANMIKTILPNIISLQQSVFLPNRLIFNNTLLTYQAFHYLKIQKKKEETKVLLGLN